MRQRITRREFVRSAALATGMVGVPFIVPASSLGAGGKVSPSNKITIGCIGVGGQGTGNMRAFLGIGEARVVAVCDTYEDRRRRAKGLVDKQYGDKGCAMFADFRELLAREDIDAVLIATQDHWHAPIALVALKPDDLHLHESTSHHADFIRSVKARSDPVSDIDAGHIASYLGMVADIGGRLQRRLKWDPKAEQFVGDEDANRLLNRPMRAPWHL